MNVRTPLLFAPIRVFRAAHNFPVLDKWLYTVTFLLLLTASGFAQTVPYTREKEWEKEIGAFAEIDQKQTPPKDAILFTGSSTIGMWTSLRRDFPKLNVINRGFGGSRLDDLVHFAPQIVLPYHPKKIVVYSGENDIEGGDSVENAVADFTAFVKFRDENLPGSEIIYLSMKPSILRWKLWPEMERGNRMIREKIGTLKKVKFVDIAANMLGPNGTPPPREIFVADGLHLNEKGYAIIREALIRYL